MTRFEFLHAADLHLDTPFQGIGRIAPTIAEALRDASLRAFDALVALALRRKVAFVLLAGDVYDGPERGVRAQLRFRTGLERLAKAGIRTFVVHGNHDPVETSWNAIRSWPEGVTIFAPGEVQSVPVERDGVRIATVHGVSYARRETTENLALRYRRGPEPGIHVGLLHANVGGLERHAPYAPCSLDDLRAAGLDYWALGHVHERQLLARKAPCWIAYPGNLQGRSPLETGPKGALVVSVEDGAIRREPELVALDVVRFADVTVSIEGVADLPELHAAIGDELARLRREHAGRGLVLRATLVGSGALHVDLARSQVREQLLGELRNASREEEPFTWWRELRDRTRAVVDRDAIRARGGLGADLIARFEELARAPERATDVLSEEEARLARTIAASPPAWRELLGEAEALVLDELETRAQES